LGDSTLFARVDEVFASWQLMTPVLEHFALSSTKKPAEYTSGTWGPKEADELLKTDGRKWRLL
jgi:glucose-6-phosphate 1-dehydrogenase